MNFKQFWKDKNIQKIEKEWSDQYASLKEKAKYLFREGYAFSTVMNKLDYGNYSAIRRYSYYLYRGILEEAQKEVEAEKK